MYRVLRLPYAAHASVVRGIPARSLGRVQCLGESWCSLYGMALLGGSVLARASVTSRAVADSHSRPRPFHMHHVNRALQDSDRNVLKDGDHFVQEGNKGMCGMGP